MREKEEERIEEPAVLAAINTVWITEVPSKVKIFGWRLLLNRLPVKEQLAKRNIIQREEDKVCVLCSEHVENLEHLFFNCHLSKIIWEKIGMWMEVHMEDNVVGAAGHLKHFVTGLKGRMKKKMRGLVWLTTLWSIWNSRNNFIFNNTNIVLDEVISSIKVVSWFWLAIGAKARSTIPLFHWFQAPIEVLKMF
ncbi:uncharacterized protein LOC131605220 [Vicia villosa]|uniref:uncharacterized protein LOC131605220 n=1 Tax=Vicia villosa TaxID=3911 RepID=UPI00273B1022|nr:uncharacterized protein LOC131605220 [Vicia villosa]